MLDDSKGGFVNPAAQTRSLGFDALNAWQQYGLQGRLPDNSTTNPIPGIERSAGPGKHTTMASWYQPSNPLFWFGVLLAGTVGLVGFATEFRVGPARAGVAVGSS